MRIVVHGQQAFGKAVLEALLKRGENVGDRYVKNTTEHEILGLIVSGTRATALTADEVASLLAAQALETFGAEVAINEVEDFADGAAFVEVALFGVVKNQGDGRGLVNIGELPEAGEVADEAVGHVGAAVEELEVLGQLVVDLEHGGDAEEHQEAEVDHRVHQAGGRVA